MSSSTTHHSTFVHYGLYLLDYYPAKRHELLFTEQDTTTKEWKELRFHLAYPDFTAKPIKSRDHIEFLRNLSARSAILLEQLAGGIDDFKKLCKDIYQLREFKEVGLKTDVWLNIILTILYGHRDRDFYKSDIDDKLSKYRQVERSAAGDKLKMLKQGQPADKRRVESQHIIDNDGVEGHPQGFTGSFHRSAAYVVTFVMKGTEGRNFIITNQYGRAIFVVGFFIPRIHDSKETISSQNPSRGGDTKTRKFEYRLYMHRTWNKDIYYDRLNCVEGFKYRNNDFPVNVTLQLAAASRLDAIPSEESLRYKGPHLQIPSYIQMQMDPQLDVGSWTNNPSAEGWMEKNRLEEIYNNLKTGNCIYNIIHNSR